MMTFTPTTKRLLAVAFASFAGLVHAQVQPTAATDGVSFANPSADVTNITAPDNAIIDYAQFNIASGQTVNFIQPSAAARVLNRINGNTPSQIDGTLNANGIVYLVNPAGVTFGNNAVVDAAGIFAAAGSISNDDFLNAINQFTAVTGDITQHGTINADVIAALIGRNVNNTGTISVPNGTAILASGETVLIGNPLGGVMVSIDATPNTDDGSINDTGTINANEVSLVSGDVFSLAVTSADASASAGSFTPDLTIADIDTDGDGDIDRDDIVTAYANFTGPLPPGTGGKTQQQGDTNGDGDVDNTDIGTLFIFFTGPITPPTPPTDNPAGEFDLSSGDLVQRLPAIGEEVNLTEADLNILRDQLGIAARQPLPSERLEKAQARALYDDFRTRANGANPDGSLTIANTRLDSDVVRQALAVYRERLAAQGLSPSERSAQIRTAVNDAYSSFQTDAPAGDGFDADAFSTYVKQNNPELFNSLSALNELNRLTTNMGLNDLEKQNSEATIVNSTKPDAMTFEQMKATIEAAGAISLAEPQVDAG